LSPSSATYAGLATSHLGRFLLSEYKPEAGSAEGEENWECKAKRLR